MKIHVGLKRDRGTGWHGTMVGAKVWIDFLWFSIFVLSFM